MRKKLLRISLVFFLIAAVVLLYGIYEAGNIKLAQYKFENKDIPQSFVGKKLVFISDIHCNHFFTASDVKNIVEKVNQLHPDFILIGGDNVLNVPEIYEPFFNEIKKLKSTYGIFSVLGNHDHWKNAKLIQEKFTECGFKICDNQSYWIKIGNDSIKIGGVGDFWNDEQILENTTNDVSSSDFCILLSHNPDYIEFLDSDKIDLMLSGHTHGGQITLFGLWAPIQAASFHPEYIQTGQKYIYGWKNKGNTKLYVTSGVGKGSIPFRFFAQPEIVEITFDR